MPFPSVVASALAVTGPSKAWRRTCEISCGVSSSYSRDRPCGPSNLSQRFLPRAGRPGHPQRQCDQSEPNPRTGAARSRALRVSRPCPRAAPTGGSTGWAAPQGAQLPAGKRSLRGEGARCRLFRVCFLTRWCISISRFITTGQAAAGRRQSQGSGRAAACGHTSRPSPKPRRGLCRQPRPSPTPTPPPRTPGRTCHLCALLARPPAP